LLRKKKPGMSIVEREEGSGKYLQVSEMRRSQKKRGGILGDSEGNCGQERGGQCPMLLVDLEGREGAQDFTL
jgi:hypothetical protein